MSEISDVIVVTTPTIPGYRIKAILGVVHGESCRTRGMLGRFISGIEALTGGRGEAYLEEIRKARKEAIEDLKNQAKMIGANAVVGVDFETNEILEGFIVVSAYGTAVIVEKESGSDVEVRIPTPLTQTYICPNCKRPATYYPQYNRWYCHYCNKWL